MGKKYFRIVLVVISVISSSLISFSQLRDYQSKVGLQFSGAIPATEFSESEGLKGSYVARILGRHELSSDFQIEIGFGYGSLAGFDFDRKYFRTELIPIDGRLLLNLSEGKTWNPYLYAGVGVLFYEVTTLPISVSPKSVDKEGSTALIPAGLGTEIALSDFATLDLAIGINHSFTDNLNYYRHGAPKDVYYTGSIGFNFTAEKDLDKDNDGLLSKEEKELGTDPRNADTDGDGLNDGDEIKKYKTNPLNEDSDGDKLKDGEEVNIYKTDPNVKDTDNDNLSDYEEIFTYKTDPNKGDSDGDGLKDGEEVIKYKTNPIVQDTDKDGLKDGEEVNIHKTDPNKADSDGGTVNDGTEIANKTNPLDPNDDIPKKEEVLKVEVGKAIVLEGIVFKTGSAEISPESEEILEKALNTLKENPEIEVEIQGHTDNVGKRSANIQLSIKRAKAVKDYLVNKGIPSHRITTKGFGPDKPIAPNTTEEGRQKNRRIEFFRIK